MSNSSSEQTKDYTIVGVVDYECNNPSEQTKDHTIVGVVDYGCSSSSKHTKAYKIDICCISSTHALIMRKSKTRSMLPSGVTCIAVNCCF